MEKPVFFFSHFMANCQKGAMKLSLIAMLTIAFTSQPNTAFAETFISDETCNDVTDGGEITGNESGCNNPIFDPSIITSVTLPSGGGTEPIEYLWIYTNDDPTGSFAIWHTIQGSSEPYYDPGPISETTYYRRCARRAGCPDFIAESNWVCKEVVCDLPNIGDTVFIDEDGDGIQDPGETGLAGVKVKLFAAGPDGAFCTPDDVMVTMTTTDANGMYLFTEVEPGTFYIEFCADTLPDGYSFTQDNQGADDETDSDADPDTGKTNVFTVNYGDDDDLSYDAGVVIDKVNVGDTVFSDANENGIQDAGETGVPNVKVKLFSLGADGIACTNDDVMDEMTTTDGNGNYLFMVCAPGTFYIQFCDLPDGLTFTSNDEGSDDGADSDADPTNGKTPPFTVNPGDEDDLTIDAGVVPVCDVNFMVSISKEDPSCHDSNDGTASASTSGGAAAFAYLWSDGLGTTASISGLSAGTYCVTVTDENGCTAENCTTLTAPVPFTFNGNVEDATCGEANGSITLSGAIVSLIWNTGATSLTINNLAPGQYCVDATNANGCTVENCFTVGTTGDLSFTLNKDDVNCSGGNDGSASVIINAGNPPYTYSWSNGATTASINNVASGEYCVTVSDATGCQDVDCIQINEPNAIELDVISFYNCGTQEGELFTTVFNGDPTETYTYEWDNGPTTAGQFPVLISENTTFCVTVTSSTGCTVSGCTEMEFIAPVEFDAVVVDANCGESNGSIELIVPTGGTGGFTYTWDHGPTTSSLTNLAPGEYCVDVDGGTSCSARECYIINGGSDITLNLTSTDPTCHDSNDGTAMATTTGGTPPVSILWSNGATGNSVNGLSGGEICATATDAAGCTMTQCITLTAPEPIELSAVVRQPMCGSPTGLISISDISGGAPPYTFDWNVPTISNSVINVGPGTYCVTLTDTNGCELIECWELIGPTPVNFDLDANDTTCGLENGSATVSNLRGGNGPYTIEWSDGSSSNTLSDLDAGEVCVTVTDASDCTGIKCIRIEDSEEIVFALDVDQATCGLANGMADVNDFRGGTGPYEILWSTGATTRTIANLPAGEYCVVITDANGCEAEQCLTIEDTNPLTFDIDITEADCGLANGVLRVANVTNGVAPFSYEWSTGASTIQIENLVAGEEYCVTVFDANGCFAETCLVLDGSPGITVSLSSIDPECTTSNDGSVVATATGGTGALTFDWATTGMIAGNVVTGLGAGEVCVEVSDALDCIATACITIAAPEPVAFDLDVDQATCGIANGMADVNRFRGGTAPYSILWSTGATTRTIANLPAGEYCVTITDTNGCEAVQCAVISNSDGPTVTTIAGPANCGSNGGFVSATATDGIAPYTYNWSTGGTMNTIDNLAPGEYCVTVTDANGCIVETCETVTGGPNVSISIEGVDPTCHDSNDGMATAIVSGGTAPFEILWSNFATGDVVTGLGAGQICATVNDSGSCLAQTCITLEAPDDIDFTIAATDADCGMNNGAANVNAVIGGTAPYTFAWNNGAMTPFLVDLPGGEYCVTVTDANGCVVEDCIEVNDSDGFEVVLTAINPTCGEINGTAIANASASATGPLTYAWDIGLGGPSNELPGLGVGQICVIVTDANGCTATDCITLVDEGGPSITTSTTNTTCGENNGTASVTATGGNAPYTYAWTGGRTGSSIGNLPAGIYCVTVTDASGCVAEICDEVLPSDPLNFNLFGSGDLCPGESGTIQVSALDMTTTYTWSTDGGVLTGNTGIENNFSSNTAGLYTITVVGTNAAGCMSTETVTVRVKTPAECDMEDKVNIGNYVWFDSNEDGIQDPFEFPAEGIKVKLISAGTDGMFNTADDVVVDMQATDALGFYLFECVEPGEYIIEFCLDTLPTDTKLTTQDAGGDDELDSDADMMTGQTDPFTVIAGQDDDLSFDAGIIIDDGDPCDNVLGGGEICCDQVLCGAGSTPDPITSVIPASGGSGALEYLWMMTTIPGPFDMDTWDEIPGETSEDYAPGPVTRTTFFARCARRAGCTTYLEANIITIEIKDRPRAIIVGLPNATCANETISFSAADGGAAVTYAWDFGAGASPATFNGRNVPGVSWSTNGTKTITLTVVSVQSGCETSTTQDIDVNDCTGGRFVNFGAAAAPDEQVALNWETNDELDDFVFVVEHSMDGENFKIIEDMQGHLVGQGSKKYDYMHMEARPGRNYYKVKHIDFDGTSISTDEEVIIISSEPKQKFILFPVPTSDVVNFESLTLTDQEGVIQVVDAYGHTLNELVIPANTKRLQVDLSPYPTGIYFLYIKYDSVRMRAHRVLKVTE